MHAGDRPAVLSALDGIHRDTLPGALEDLEDDIGQTPVARLAQTG